MRLMQDQIGLASDAFFRNDREVATYHRAMSLIRRSRLFTGFTGPRLLY